MTDTPIAHAASLRIGTVDFVSPDEIKIQLEIEAPDSVALNAGGVRPFPRVNGYILCPVDDAYLVGQIEWLTVERSNFPKRRGIQDFGLVDLPFPLRKMSANPLGTLRKLPGKDDAYAFRRGADSLPSVGGPAVLPTDRQLRSIVESGDRRRVKIGTSPLAGNAEVRVDPDRVFGRHIAVLGNTGSGKSCSVAGLIRWSLEEARTTRTDGARANARFLVLDPNGEYSRAFASDSGPKARIFRVTPTKGEAALQVPLWFWNSAEWASFTQASARTQRPLLRRALREVKAGKNALDETSEDEQRLALRRYLSSMVISIRRDLRSGALKTDESKFGFRLKAISEDLQQKSTEFPKSDFSIVRALIDKTLTASFNSFVDKSGKQVEFYRAFPDAKVQEIIQGLTAILEPLGGLLINDGPEDDIPVPFSGADLADHLQVLAEQENVSQFVDFLVSRIRSFLSDSKINAVVGSTGEPSLAGWLNEYVGSSDPDHGELAILDLSLVPSEVVHVVTAVTARIVFEALQRYRRLNGVTLPTVLVMEEAHTFVKRYRDDVENSDAATICCQVFERIAREGRKFGLGLVLSSQRPSELSPTVLSQCNSFLLHRISNDRDQEIVNRLVPDNLRGLLRELPSLPSQSAILLGWATELPILVRMDDLSREHQPRSDDPDFWDVWTGKNLIGTPVDRPSDWQSVANDWQGIVPVHPVAKKPNKKKQ